MNISREEAQQILDALSACDAVGSKNERMAAAKLLQSRLAEGEQELTNKLVPVEPTEVMLVLGLDAVKKNQFHYNGSVIKYSTPEKYLLKVAYKAMLSAAPQGAPK